MGKRDSIDNPRVEELLRAWRDESLSEEGEQELDRILRYAARVNMSDSEYDALAADSEKFISNLAVSERKRNRRKVWRYAMAGSVAAACAAVAVVSAWMNIGTAGRVEQQDNVGIAVVTPPETVKKTSNDLYAVQDKPTADAVKASKKAKRQLANEQKRKTVSIGHAGTGKASTHAQEGLTDEEAEAWRMFMAARMEMEEVVKPDMAGAIWNDVPDLTGQNETNNDINLPVGIYESLETVGEMLNSLYSGE